MAAEVSTAVSTHPRRTPARSSDADGLIDAFHNMSLRKLETVHAPSNTSSDLLNPIDAARGASPAYPLRATTCPQSLEELLISTGERRAADLLARVDEAIATQSKLALGSVLRDPEVLPVPAFMVESTPQQDDEGLKTRTRSHRRSHSSDSGIGSSVESVSGKSSHTVDNTIVAGVQPPSPIDAAVEERGLSEYAKDQIHKHIIKPILREQSLKEFHPIIKEVPRKIGNKQIKTLRELEKALIFVAPEYTPSPAKYLEFCERTIRVLHTTVTTLHDSDQRAPTDRPYTQGYFVDLVEQIRRYATILAATRARQERGEKPDEMDYTPDESVSLHGGVSHNGKAAELVRHKDGKVISIATGQELTAEELASSSIKRPMSDEDVDNDDVLRSMARRKKNAKPEIHECPLCDKEFKRPCDLTKHVKTHERPWKCPDSECKYHALGWPTEKERDRHVNDKHSSAPSLYHCLFKPCPYTSKRESNCKQHMEKAHGWTYVRSKNNGKSRADDAMRLPQGSVPPSPASAMLTPLTPIAPSPSNQSWSTSSRADSLAPQLVPGPSSYGTPAFAQPSPDFAPDFNDHFNMNFNFNDISDGFASTSAFPMTPAHSEDRRTSMSAASSHGVVFDDAITPEDVAFEDNFGFNMNYQQQPTPDSNIGMGVSSGNMDTFPEYSAPSAGPSSAYISPNNNADMAFISPHPSYDGMDMGEDALSASLERPNEDFTLFNNSAFAQVTSGAAEMFPTLSNEGSSWHNFGTQFDGNQPMQLKSDNSALNELFPELTNSM